MKGTCYVYEDSWVMDPVTHKQPIKIGKTSVSLNKRMQGLKTATPGKINILLAADFDDVNAVEKALHKLGKDTENHICREWFNREVLSYFEDLFKATGKPISINEAQPAMPPKECWVECQKTLKITHFTSFNKAAKFLGTDFRYISKMSLGKMKPSTNDHNIYFKKPKQRIPGQFQFGGVK